MSDEDIFRNYLNLIRAWRPSHGLKLSVIGGLIISGGLTLLLNTLEDTWVGHNSPNSILVANLVIVILNFPGLLIGGMLGSVIGLMLEAEFKGVAMIGGIAKYLPFVGSFFVNAAFYALILYRFHGQEE
jgi:hypothetical protein